YYSFPAYPAGAMIPEVSVPLYSADYFARHDPFLAAVVAKSSPRPQSPSSAIAIVNSASFRAGDPVAPGSLASVFGDFSIAQPEVTIGGIASRVLASAAGQINFLIPGDVRTGIVPIQIRSGGSIVAEGSVGIAPAAPGLFILDPFALNRPG